MSERPKHGSVPVYPDLKGRVAVVTGGSGGIGSATCRLLASNGVKVAVSGRNEAAIESVVEGIRLSSGEAIGVSADCTDFDALEDMRRTVESKLGDVDILVAFASGGSARPGPVSEIAEADWRSTVDDSLTATFLTVKSFLPGMEDRGRGSVVTMSSAAARMGTNAPSPYAAAKAGVISLTKDIAREAATFGVRANCIAPSTVLVERMAANIPGDQQRRIAESHPLGRLGTPEDVGLATLFLASDSAAWITGVTLDVAGGIVMP